jgi:hypothetical protein
MTTPKDDFSDYLPFRVNRLVNGRVLVQDKAGCTLFYVDSQDAPFLAQWLVQTLNEGQAKDDTKERCLQILADIKDDLLSSEDPNSYSRWEWGVHDGLDAAMKAIEDNLPATSFLRDELAKDASGEEKGL